MTIPNLVRAAVTGLIDLAFQRRPDEPDLQDDAPSPEEKPAHSTVAARNRTEHCSHGQPRSDGRNVVCNTYGQCPSRTARHTDTLRVDFGADAGAYVKGFPSKGGVYTAHCSAMELCFLGLDRFEPAPRSSDPVEEDAFCAKFRLLGPKWWPCFYAQDRAWSKEFQEQNGQYCPEEKVRFIGVAPQGGVWVLETNNKDCDEKSLGRIRNAMDMNEKCREIERFGGTFYADPADCRLLDVNLPFPERADTHVLVVDDHGANRKVAQKIMERFGFTRVTTLGNGKQALDYLIKAVGEGPLQKPDIILIDTQMLAMDGLECSWIIRHEPLYKDYADIPIIASQHYTVVHTAEMRLAAGMDDCVARPFRFQEFEQKLAKWGRARSGDWPPDPSPSVCAADAEYDAIDKEANLEWENGRHRPKHGSGIDLLGRFK